MAKKVKKGSIGVKYKHKHDKKTRKMRVRPQCFRWIWEGCISFADTKNNNNNKKTTYAIVLFTLRYFSTIYPREFAIVSGFKESLSVVQVLQVKLINLIMGHKLDDMFLIASTEFHCDYLNSQDPSYFAHFSISIYFKQM